MFLCIGISCRVRLTAEPLTNTKGHGGNAARLTCRRLLCDGNKKPHFSVMAEKPVPI